jgi:hypothetical protein
MIRQERSADPLGSVSMRYDSIKADLMRTTLTAIIIIMDTLPVRQLRMPMA